VQISNCAHSAVCRNYILTFKHFLPNIPFIARGVTCDHYLYSPRNQTTFFSYAQRRKRTVYYLFVNKWVRALGLCLLLLQST